MEQAKNCSICGKSPALYWADGRYFCAAHKQEAQKAMAHLRKHPSQARKIKEERTVAAGPVSSTRGGSMKFDHHGQTKTNTAETYRELHSLQVSDFRPR